MVTFFSKAKFTKTMSQEYENYNDNQISELVRNHFFNLRESQRQNCNMTSLTDDIRFTVCFVNSSVVYPVPLLKKMGIIVIKGPKKMIAINFLQIQYHLNLPRNKTMTSLHREGWKDADDSQRNQLGVLVGKINVKDWSLLLFPEDTNLAKYISENHRVLASEETMFVNNNKKNKVNTLMNNRTEDVVFPLVTVQYERDFFNMENANYPPDANFQKMPMQNLQRPNLQIVQCASFNCMIGNEK